MNWCANMGGSIRFFDAIFGAMNDSFEAAEKFN